MAVSLSIWNEELDVKRLQKRIGVIQPITEMFSNDPRLDRPGRLGTRHRLSAALRSGHADRTRRGRELDPTEVGLFSFLVFSKLEGAVTVGDDPPRRPARPVPRARRRPTRR